MKGRGTSAWRVVIAGGESQLIAGLAIADELARFSPPPAIVFCGTSGGRARLRLPAAYQRLEGEPAAGPTARRLWQRLTRAWGGDRELRHLLDDGLSTVFVSVGGEGSEAVVRSALARGKPVVLFESSPAPSRAARRFGSLVQLICLAVEETRSQLAAACPVRFVGHPVPPADFRGGLPPHEGRRRLLVLHDGRRHDSLHLQLPRVLQKLRDSLEDWHVEHEAGAHDFAAVCQQYEKGLLPVAVRRELDARHSALAAADLVVARSGGAHLPVLAAAGVPSIIVHSRPFQEELGWFAGRGACRVVPEDTAWLESQLLDELQDLLQNDLARTRMKQALHAHVQADSAWKIASMVRDLAGDANSGLAA